MNSAAALPLAGGSISPRAFRTIVEVVHSYCGIALGPDKQNLVANRLRKRLVVLGLRTYDDYCDGTGNQNSVFHEISLSLSVNSERPRPRHL